MKGILTLVIFKKSIISKKPAQHINKVGVAPKNAIKIPAIAGAITLVPCHVKEFIATALGIASLVINKG